MIETLQKISIKWLPYLEEHLWLYPEKLDQKECLVFGTGYESWGVWAHINANLFIAEAISWEDKLFDHLETNLKSKNKRIEIAINMFHYALAYHSTGVFDGAGGTKWGAEPKESEDKEGYNNWHSPLWVTFLAEVFFTIEEYLDEKTKKRFYDLVVHDADVQISLNIFNFDGEAEEKNKSSHPESNAWKACLLLLARGLDPKNQNVSKWEALEKRLWVSSFAIPGDEKNINEINGKAISELAIGNHLTTSFNVIHHGFMHPCYMVFPLLSRLQAARFCEIFKFEYPLEASLREEEVFGRLLPFVINGRVVYPAGKDWPRWVYGQSYLLPIMMYRNRSLEINYDDQIKQLIKTREVDLTHSSDNSFVIHRFGDLINKSAWKAQRFETDSAASIIQAIQILKSNSNNPKEYGSVTYKKCCYEPLAKTVYLKRETCFFGISARANEGPGQLTAIKNDNPHLLEWKANGCSEILRLHGVNKGDRKNIVNEKFHVYEDDSIAGRFDIIHAQEPYKKPSFRTEVMAAVPSSKDLLLVHQKVISQCYTSAELINLHIWKFSQSPHNNYQREITFENGSLKIRVDDEINQKINSPWVCIDGQFCVNLPMGQEIQSWWITQNSSCVDTGLGARWFEVYVKIHVDSTERIEPNRIIGDTAIEVTFADKPRLSTVDFKDDFVLFQEADAKNKSDKLFSNGTLGM